MHKWSEMDMHELIKAKLTTPSSKKKKKQHNDQTIIILN